MYSERAVMRGMELPLIKRLHGMSDNEKFVVANSNNEKATLIDAPDSHLDS